MTAEDVVAELKALGSESTKKTLLKHGATEPIFGTKIGDMKPLMKKLKGDHQLVLALYDTGVSDAMYLAGLLADPAKMTEAQLRKWAKAAPWHMIGEYSVAGVAAESPFAVELAEEWIASPKEALATIGWMTYAGYVSITPDDELDFDRLRDLVWHCRDDVHEAANRTRYTMNGFVIAVGCYVKPLLTEAKKAAKAMGAVTVEMASPDCKVPLATESIAKVEKLGRVGTKRKSARC
jgi:3-methyladenine DNA glycosylase AlkD